MTPDEKNMLFIDGYRSGYEDAKKQWQGLTEEEIAEIWVECGLDDCDAEGFARAIEAKLKEKNS